MPTKSRYGCSLWRWSCEESGPASGPTSCILEMFCAQVEAQVLESQVPYCFAGCFSEPCFLLVMMSRNMWHLRLES